MQDNNPDNLCYFVLGFNGNKIFFKLVSDTETKYIALNKKLTREDVALHLKVPYELASKEIPKIINAASQRPLDKTEVYEIFAKSKGELK